MSVQGVARRYASALADVVIEHNEAEPVREELSQWAQMMRDNPALLEVFRTPTVPYEQKQNLLGELLSRARVRPTTANFLRIVLRNQRLADVEDIYQAFAKELNARAGVVAASVTTAHAVSPEVREALQERLKNLTGQNVQLEFAVDENLIGGVVTRIGSTIYDGSVRSQLEQIKDKLTGEQQ